MLIAQTGGIGYKIKWINTWSTKCLHKQECWVIPVVQYTAVYSISLFQLQTLTVHTFSRTHLDMVVMPKAISIKILIESRLDAKIDTW